MVLTVASRGQDVRRLSRLDHLRSVATLPTASIIINGLDGDKLHAIDTHLSSVHTLIHIHALWHKEKDSDLASVK